MASRARVGRAGVGAVRLRAWTSLLVVCAGWAVPAAAQAQCIADLQIVVSAALPKAECDAAPMHVANVACCSGKMSSFWNAATSKCDLTCDSSNPCDYVTCTPFSQCHLAGTCNPATGLCSNPTRSEEHTSELQSL